MPKPNPKPRSIDLGRLQAEFESATKLLSVATQALTKAQNAYDRAVSRQHTSKEALEQGFRAVKTGG